MVSSSLNARLYSRSELVLGSLILSGTKAEDEQHDVVEEDVCNKEANALAKALEQLELGNEANDAARKEHQGAEDAKKAKARCRNGLAICIRRELAGNEAQKHAAHYQAQVNPEQVDVCPTNLPLNVARVDGNDGLPTLFSCLGKDLPASDDREHKEHESNEENQHNARP